MRRFHSALALTTLALLPTIAAAQDPFSIDAPPNGGVVTAASNSGVTASPENAAPCKTGVGGSIQACMITAPNELNGSSKERGPINSNTTKIGVINTAPTPMLGDTNPNSNTDLNTVFTQSKKANDGDLWYYVGWIKDSAGTSLLAVEFEQNPIDVGCRVGGAVTGAVDYSLASCNPWKGRQGGTGVNADFMIVWDQSGSTTDIIKRNFVCSNGAAKCSNALGTGALVVIAACTSPISTNQNDACHRLAAADAIATFGAPTSSRDINDASRGELAIDLSTQVFGPSGTCQSFANIIPGTVTGNSDNADYKDVVLSAFPAVSNCGTVTITKSTDPAGLAGTFTYTLAANADIFATGGVDTDCSVSGSSDLSQCRGTLITTTTTPYTNTDTISSLLEHDTNWTLAEDDPSASDFTVKSIDCTDSQNVTYHLAGDGTLDTAFRVEAGATTACTIVNKLVKATPSETTSQSGTAAVTDTINITGLKAGASDASSAKVKFRLYGPIVPGNPLMCVDSGQGANLVYTSNDFSLTYGNPATTASAALVAYVNISPGLTYAWKVEYSGDVFNSGFTTSCGEETATASFVFVGQP
jgi:hypothetical protein